MRHLNMWVLLSMLLVAQTARADEAAEIQQLRELLLEIKSDYDARILDLETRLAKAERKTSRAVEIAEDTAITAGAGQSGPNTFNPAIGSVLVGRYTNLDNNWESVPGFASDGELGPGDSGFSLGESEINFKAAIDGLFYGNLTLALEDDAGDTEVGVEEAWVQTLGLPYGFTARGGRYFSGIGYLNSFHRHADDFTDRPLPYQAFFGGQYIEDGAQVRWLAPTRLFFEVGAELNWGDRFPATGGGSSADAWDVFAHLGGDLGSSHSWQVGMSYMSFDNNDRAAGEDEADTFNGDSDLVGIDFVWKWAPNGNSSVRNFKLQGEYFQREEDGDFGGLDYNGDQDGWYLQGVWQFAPRWRVGYRHDQMDSDNGDLLVGTVLEDPDHTPQRDSVMFDWSASEYSRIRLQYTYDQVERDSDNQLTLQYIMSLGAHGAHQF
jgi:hypothetical protein